MCVCVCVCGVYGYCISEITVIVFSIFCGYDVVASGFSFSSAASSVWFESRSND